MARVNVFGEFETSDFTLAAFLSCDNYLVVKCVTNGTNDSTTWTFRDIPSCDLDIYLEEVTKDETQVPLLRFLRGLKTIQSVQAEAKRNFGYWSSTRGWSATL